jgi:hypothetical protein
MISRRILAAVALLCAFIVPAHAQKAKAALTTEINTNWPDNSVGGITPALLRSTVTDIVNSYYDLNGGSSLSCPSSQWVTGLPTLSSLACSQPFTVISGDCTATSLGVISCTKTNGTPFGTMAVQNASAVVITGGTITGLSSPTNPSDAATKQYVDNSAAGLTPHTQVVLATTAALAANTYNNGTAGVGATLTGNSNAALSIDGVAVSTSQRVLIKNEAAAANNGIYTITAAGSGSAAYVLTRATDANTPGTGSPNEIGFGTYVLVTAGSTNINSGWSVNSVVTTIGTSAINWAQFSAQSGVATVSNSDTSLTISPTVGAVVASVNRAFAFVWSGIHKFTANVFFTANAYFGGVPFFDVKSGAHSCTAALGNGSTDDTAAIQCAITYMNTTYGGGTVYFPPATYLVSGGGLAVPQGIWLVGSSIDSTIIEVATNSIVLNPYITGGTCPSGGLNGGIDKLSIYGYQNAGATQPAILIGANCVFNIYNSRVWFGIYGLNNQGADGTIFNSFICGYQYNVVSTGANWYERTKLDSCGIGPSAFAYLQNSSATLQENHFLNSDFSCGCAASFVIADGHNNSVTSFVNSVFDSPIGITNAKAVQMIGDEVGSTAFTISAGTLLMSSTYALASTTIGGPGGRACAANSNVNFTNC